jgi:hypothetical protein
MNVLEINLHMQQTPRPPAQGPSALPPEEKFAVAFSEVVIHQKDSYISV